jgi:beta-glucanase (GH16 family)
VVVDRRKTDDGNIRWYLDGRPYLRVDEKGNKIGRSIWNAAIDHGFAIIFDLAIGGVWPNSDCGCTTSTAKTTSPGTLSIRYVAVYVQRA